jgi:hypothetical protein
VAIKNSGVSFLPDFPDRMIERVAFLRDALASNLQELW